MGWWYPTTLTAGRCYFGSSTVHNISVSGTTSEIRIVMDRASTDVVWDSTTAGITVDKWWFIAVMGAQGTSTAGVYAWVGDELTPPVLLSLTNTTPLGGSPTGSSTVAVGNQGPTDVQAFQGDAESVLFAAYSSSTTDGCDCFGLASPGNVDTVAQDVTYNRWIYPFWSGNHITPPLGGRLSTLAYTEILFFPLIGSGALDYRISTVATVGDTHLTPVINGATVSARRAPRSYPNPINSWGRRR